MPPQPEVLPVKTASGVIVRQGLDGAVEGP